MFGSILGSIGSSLVGGLFNKHQTDKSNQTSIELANTQYQRARKDLEKAGYNPMLAVGGTAPTPAIQSARVDTSSIGSAFSSAMQNKIAKEQLKLNERRQEEEIKNLEATRNQINATTQGINLSNSVKQLEKDNPKKILGSWGGKVLRKFEDTLFPDTTGVVVGKGSSKETQRILKSNEKQLYNV